MKSRRTASRKSIEGMGESWVGRIIQNCDEMARVVILLRDMTKARPNDAELSSLVEQLHVTYCNMANTISLRVMLNGAARDLACIKADHER